MSLTKNTVVPALLIYFCVILGPQVFSQLPDTWVTKSDFGGTERWGVAAFSIGNKGYMGTGFASGFLKDFWEYDPATDSWTQKADFGGTARAMATGFSIDNKGYVGCGDDDNQLQYHGSKDFWEYDPVTNIWTRKADFGGVPRRGAVGFSIQSKGYLGTGRTNDAGTPGFVFKFKDFWEYNPATDIWSQKADFGGEERAFASGFSIDNKGYVGTGRILTTFARDFWEYNPVTNTWLKKADFGGVVRYGAVGFVIGNCGYIGTGITLSGLSKDFWKYDPAADSWVQKSDFGGSSRYLAAGFTIGNTGYIGTGQINDITYENSNDLWGYTPCLVPAIVSQPGNQAVTYGSSVSFSVLANSAVSYQWQEDSGSGFVNINDGGKYTNTTKADLTVLLPDVSMNSYKYRCVVTGNCLPTATTNGNATLTVVPLPITITPDPGQAKIYGSADPTSYTYTYSPALIGSDTITGSMGRVAGENAGDYSYTAGTLSAGSNYSLTLAAMPTYGITQLAIAVTPDSGQAKIYGSTDPTSFTYTYAPTLIGSDTMTGSMGRIAGENTGNYPYTVGTLSAGSNYSITLATMPTFGIIPLPISVTPHSGQAKIYGSADPTSFTYTYAPTLIGSDTITGSIGRVAGENAGDYAYTVGTLSAGSNYSITLATMPTFGITPLAIAVTPDSGQAKIYGSTDPTSFTYTYAPTLMGSDSITGSIDRVAGENAGDYAYTAGTLSAGSNYSLTLAAMPTFSITPLAIAVTPDSGQAKVYGSADPTPFTYTFQPALFGSDTFTGSLGREPGENVGEYIFSVGTLSAGSNYALQIAVVPDFTITPLVSVKTLNLKIFTEGLFNGATMNKARNASEDQFPGNIADEIKIELHSSTSPFEIVGEPFTVGLNTNGETTLTVPLSFTDSYYIVVKHRNSIETWSAIPVSFSDLNLSYDFTTSKEQAFGNNLKLVSGKLVLFGGDADQDGIIDANDLILIDNDAANFLTGYLQTDIDGNGSINSDDFMIVSANASDFVAKTVPR